MEGLKISEDKKKYIVELLNPVLEEMVAECIHKMPSDPVPFMLEWLELKKATDEDKALTAEEKEQLTTENMNLQGSINKVKTQVRECALIAADGQDGKEEEEEEDDDADDEPPPGFEIVQTNKARCSVSAEAYGEWNTKKAFVPPVIQKTDKQKERLKECLRKVFLFSNLEESDMSIVIGAMNELNVNKDDTIIKQGDDGDCLYVIESGTLGCYISKDGEDKQVKTVTTGDVFGELALLYNCPRAATVKAQDAECCIWKLDRDTFNNIVKEASVKKRNRYDTFLSKVPLLASMDAYERSQLADAMLMETFQDGEVIMKEGEEGHKFYIIEEGSAVATKKDVEVMRFSEGDYFGELALITCQPRQATVTSAGPTKLVSVGRSAFERLLNTQELFKRAERYK